MPEIVLLPGLDGTGEMFARVQALLDGEVRTSVVRYPNDPAFAYADYVAYAKSIIGDRRVFLLGESFSGPVSMGIAHDLGDQITGLVLVATFVLPPWPAWMIRRAATVDPKATPVAIRDWVLMGNYQDAEMKGTVERIVTTLPRAVRGARLLQVAGVDARSKLMQLRCPILALHGSGDWLVPKRSLVRAINGKRGAAMTTIAGAHMLLQTRSAEAARHILRFVHAVQPKE